MTKLVSMNVSWTVVYTDCTGFFLRISIKLDLFVSIYMYFYPIMEAIFSLYYRIKIHEKVLWIIFLAFSQTSAKCCTQKNSLLLKQIPNVKCQQMHFKQMYLLIYFKEFIWKISDYCQLLPNIKLEVKTFKYNLLVALKFSWRRNVGRQYRFWLFQNMRKKIMNKIFSFLSLKVFHLCNSCCISLFVDGLENCFVSLRTGAWKHFSMTDRKVLKRNSSRIFLFLRPYRVQIRRKLWSSFKKQRWNSEKKS